MRKKWKKQICLFWTAAAFVLTSLLPVLPARADEVYTYTVTIYSGDKGYFAGNQTAVTVTSGTAQTETAVGIDGNTSKIVITDLSYGDRIYVNFTSVPLYSEYKDIYSAWGVRQAGRDSSTAAKAVDVTLPPSFEVTQDADYVIAYSLLTDPVSYTIRYLEKGSGKEMRAPQSGKADIGKTIYVGAEAISGYVPDANNKSLTLNADETENVIEFYYSAIGHTTQTNTVTETETVTTTETQYVPGGTTVTDLGTVPGTAGTVTGGADGAAGTGGGGNGAGNEAGEGEGPVTVIEDEDLPLDSGIEEPAELEDLDDEETPLSLPSLDESGASKSLLFVYVAIALLGALGLFGIGFFLLKRRRGAGTENDTDE